VLPKFIFFVGKSETVGRYMVAKRDIQPGEVVFTDEPAVIGPDNNAVPMCIVCWRYILMVRSYLQTSQPSLVLTTMQSNVHRLLEVNFNGEVVFTDEPAVIGPDNNAVPMCIVCWR
jgi:hypothetical protein